jgi:cellulose synthase/poly-beta-1,6-N-acetylglucosamine synthase-like glycosyltransferase
MVLIHVISFLYIVCAVFLALYAGSQLLLLLIYIRRRHQHVAVPPVQEWPSVVVQLPMYNEANVVQRLLEAVAKLDYPQEKLYVQVLDDSTDETVQLAAKLVAELIETGLQIRHVLRPERKGFKAGALAYGLTLVNAEYAAVLDADFVPPPDFLKRTIPFLVNDPRLGMVQTRWGHLNPFNNLLTWGQTLALDGHFVVEQTARNRGNWLMTFNGSGGVWRAEAIRTSGGWRDLTLTEDLDLSYRAQLAGWRFFYLPDVVVPGELPPQMAAFKQQQARWAKGTTQCLGHILVPLWKSDYSLFQRLMATLHLCQYMPAPVMLFLLILTPVLLHAGALKNMPLSVLGIIGLVTPMIYVFSQQALYPDWFKRLLAYPVLMALGIGIAWSNTRAVIGGLFNIDTEFRRTPKFNTDWKGSHYALQRDKGMLVELFFSAYAFFSCWVALNTTPTYAPYLFIYGMAFAIVALWGVYDRWSLKRGQRQAEQTTALASK